MLIVDGTLSTPLSELAQLVKLAPREVQEEELPPLEENLGEGHRKDYLEVDTAP